MDISLDVIKGIQRVKEQFDSAKLSNQAASLLRKAMNQWLQKIAAQASLNAISMFRTHPSGQLARNIMSVVARRGMSGEVYSKLPYAGVQEEGTKNPIRPVNVQYLTQPLPAAQTKTGRLKMSARKFFEKYQNNPKVSVFIRKSKKGNLIIFMSERMKTKTKLTPLFLLRKETSIEGKFYIYRAIESTPGFDQFLGDDFINLLKSL